MPFIWMKATLWLVCLGHTSSVGHLANEVTAFYSLYCGQFYGQLCLMTIFSRRNKWDISGCVPSQAGASSKTRTMMSQIQNFSYKPQLFHFTKVPLDRLNPVPVGTTHPSPKDHAWIICFLKTGTKRESEADWSSRKGAWKTQVVTQVFPIYPVSSSA